jgi:hypothetical protein
MEDDSWVAADSRAGEARRAGLQAKKEEQPANTKRSYIAKQKEWRAWCSAPRPGPDGTSYSWPDGELVTPDKLAAWLKEDILLRRVKVPKKRRAVLQSGGDEQTSLREAEALATTLNVTVAEAVQILSEDRRDYVPPTGMGSGEVAQEGSLFTKSTVDAYVAAVIELWRVQVAHGSKNTENPRGIAVCEFLEQRGRRCVCVCVCFI